jgi:glycosyltransferase involved in cell wall biosynthesis
MIFSNRISIFCEDYFYSFFAHNFFRKKVEIIPPFVDIIPNLNNNIPNLNNNKLIIGFLGRVCVEKGIENLIEASFILEKKRIKH